MGCLELSLAGCDVGEEYDEDLEVEDIDGVEEGDETAYSWIVNCYIGTNGGSKKSYSWALDSLSSCISRCQSKVNSTAINYCDSHPDDDYFTTRYKVTGLFDQSTYVDEPSTGGARRLARVLLTSSARA